MDEKKKYDSRDLWEGIDMERIGVLIGDKW